MQTAGLITEVCNTCPGEVRTLLQAQCERSKEVRETPRKKTPGVIAPRHNGAQT